jgi:hypothetical protein
VSKEQFLFIPLIRSTKKVGKQTLFDPGAGQSSWRDHAGLGLV